MTEQTQGSTEITFSEEQQKYVNKLVGKARIAAREKAVADAVTAQEAAAMQAEQDRMTAENEWQKLATHHEARVLELEPLEGQVKTYRKVVNDMLRERVKTLGDAAKQAVDALPEGLSVLDKLKWLNANEALFKDKVRQVVGTPARKKKSQVTDDKGREAHVRMRL